MLKDVWHVGTLASGVGVGEGRGLGRGGDGKDGDEGAFLGLQFIKRFLSTGLKSVFMLVFIFYVFFFYQTCVYFGEMKIKTY